MVYIQQWDEFQKSAEEMYSHSPKVTRYVAKYRHVDGKLILKVTDTRTTDQLQDLNKFERLNRSLMAKMHNRAPPAATQEGAASATTSTSTSHTSAAAAATAATANAASVTISSPSLQHGGGGKAKKNKRR
ncbi:hypothetical protein BG004_005940 [Podila humilis]|nr:hypothetical protein BG004_005940 [Podila humilis]